MPDDVELLRRVYAARLPVMKIQALVRGSLKRIAEEGAGVLVYLHQTGLGLHTEDARIVGHDRHVAQPPLQHEVGLGAQILSDLGAAYHPITDE
jgi:GTP cyclohydrolase II